MTSVPIGDEAEWHDLVIRKGSDCDFDVEWYQPDGVTLIPIVSATGAVKDKYDGTMLVNLNTYISIIGGIAQVRIPAAFTSGLTAIERGVWGFTATSATDVKTLLEGNARIREDV